jgi:hypothetical protein
MQKLMAEPKEKGKKTNKIPYPIHIIYIESFVFKLFPTTLSDLSLANLRQQLQGMLN